MHDRLKMPSLKLSCMSHCAHKVDSVRELERSIVKTANLLVKKVRRNQLIARP